MFLAPRESFRQATLRALGPEAAQSAVWTAGAIPTLQNAHILLRGFLPTLCPHWRAALSDTSLASPLDGAQGNYEQTLLSVADATPNTVASMSLAFSTVIMPLGSARATRVKAWRYWRSCLTWAVARGSCDQLLPMSGQALQAMLWDFATMGASNSTLKAVLDAVLARHREARLPPPISGHLAYHRLARALGRVLGTQRPHKMGITRDMVVALLRQSPADLPSFRNNLALCTATMGCMRPGEVAMAQTCDLKFNGDYDKGLLQYKDCSTLCTLTRKQDQERKGHWMRFGVSDDPALDINYQLGLFMDMAGTRPGPGCSKRSRPGARCTSCFPLFPKLRRDGRGGWSVHPDPRPTANAVSAMVTSALETLGLDTSAFSGVSCRMGGLTVAIEAGVPEHILWMQSGHAQDRAARRYVRLTNPDRLYDTWRAFRL
jgi:hypothetical protein